MVSHSGLTLMSRGVHAWPHLFSYQEKTFSICEDLRIKKPCLYYRVLLRILKDAHREFQYKCCGRFCMWKYELTGNIVYIYICIYSVPRWSCISKFYFHSCHCNRISWHCMITTIIMTNSHWFISQVSVSSREWERYIRPIFLQPILTTMAKDGTLLPHLQWEIP